MALRFLLFHVVACTAAASFLASLLWTYGYIRRAVLLDLGWAKVRVRNLIDLWMIASRLTLPLPWIEQLRVDPWPLLTLSGLAIFAIGVSFIVLGVRRISPRLLRGDRIGLVTDGVYGVVRHPIYFGDSLWPMGWSLAFGAICSLLLTPLWLAAYIITTFKEEEELLRTFGREYEEYRKRVKRIIPYVY